MGRGLLSVIMAILLIGSDFRNTAEAFGNAPFGHLPAPLYATYGGRLCYQANYVMPPLDSELEDESCSQGIGVIRKRIFREDTSDIEVYYPAVVSRDKARDRKINQLIEGHIYELINMWSDAHQNDDEITYFMDLNFKITYISDSFISISYIGDSGFGVKMAKTMRLLREYFTVNIDVKDLKIIEMDDIIQDKDQIYRLLAADQFEQTTLWDGVKGCYPYSENSDAVGPETGLSSDYFRFYIQGNRFGLLFDPGRYYYEYEIDLDRVREYLNQDILDRIPLTATNRRTGRLATDDSFCVCGLEIGSESEDIYEESWRTTEVCYPSFHRENRRQSETINNLIEKNMREIIEEERSRFASGREFYLNLTYEIKYISDSFISIAFTGKGGRRIHPEDRFYTLNIDVKKHTAAGPRVVSLDKETEQIFHSLKTGQFESIRRWKSDVPDPYIPEGAVPASKGQEANPDRPGVQFYICGNSFVFVVRKDDGYYEYAIELDKLRGYLDGGL